MAIKQIKKSDKVVRLDIACGDNKREGFIGVDIAPTESSDIVYDLEKFPWTFVEDESVDEIHVSHYIEHTKDIIKFMDEIHRILKPAKFSPDNPNQPICGFGTILAPYYNSIRCWQDPTHTRAISEATYLYFNKDWRVQNKLDHYGIKSNFNFWYSYNLSPEWQGRSTESLNFAIKHYTNVVNDIITTIVKI